MATNTNEVNLRAQNQFKKLLDEHNTEHGFTSEEDQAKLFARAIETQMLKSPSSAKWPDLSDIVVAKEEDNTYKVLGYCEAQNSNGVYLREEYKFNLKLSPDGTWETTDSFISTADAIRQQTKNDINEMNTQAHANALVYFIIISIIGLAIWFIEMAYLGF